MSFWTKFRNWAFTPGGYCLLKADGQPGNTIRGDMIPVGMYVIINDGRNYVKTGSTDENGFPVYQEGARTYTYTSSGE